MIYLTKNFQDLFPNNNVFNRNYQKPGICPHCGFSCDAKHVDSHKYMVSGYHYIIFMVLQCTACQKFFTATYDVDKQKAELLGITPKTISSFHDELIDPMSPRFVETYNQALRAKDNGDFSLAAIGFRASLEILVKDYAIVELRKDVKNVSGKTLYDAISEYLPAKDLTKVSDVVRILGNDYAHYSRKYPEYDFALLDEYMKLFISLVRAQLLINHPPVSR